jgi:hypothetical protein
MRSLIIGIEGVAIDLIAWLAKAQTQPGSEPGHAVTDHAVIANADRAYAEIRAVLDHQVKTAETLDTKAGALLTITVAAAAIAAPRIRIDSDERLIAGTVAFALIGLLATFILGTLWPRAFSFGADPSALAEALETYGEASVALARAEAASSAWKRNDDALDSKHLWYSCALLTLPMILLSIAHMVSVRAVVYAP